MARLLSKLEIPYEQGMQMHQDLEDTWRIRYGQPNAHNDLFPKAFWLERWEKQAIIGYYLVHPGEEYLRLTYMMLDAELD